MSRWCFMVIIALAVLVYTVTARDIPRGNEDTIGLTYQKNVYNYGGMGRFAGLGNNGLPMGGMGTGVGLGDDFGGANGMRGVGVRYQYGGPGGIAGGAGTFGGLGNGFGGLPTLGGGGFGGASAGMGGGVGGMIPTP